jgi:hypothetical protein
MKTNDAFQEIVGSHTGNTFRGINLGDNLEEVVKREGKKYYESTEVMTFLRYYFKLKSNDNFEYKVIYHYDNNRQVEKITLTLEFDKSILQNIKLAEFDQLVNDFSDFLENRYGKPEIREKDVKDYGKEIYHTWIDAADPDQPIQITQMFYSNKKEQIEKAMKLEFQYYYE